MVGGFLNLPLQLHSNDNYTHYIIIRKPVFSNSFLFIFSPQLLQRNPTVIISFSDLLHVLFLLLRFASSSTSPSDLLHHLRFREVSFCVFRVFKKRNTICVDLHHGADGAVVVINIEMESELQEALTLPPLIYKPDDEPDIKKTIMMHSKLDVVNTVYTALGNVLFKRIEESFLKNVVKLGRRPGLNFSGKLFHFLMQRRILTKGEELWFRFGCHPMRFSKREFFLTSGTFKFVSHIW